MEVPYLIVSSGVWNVSELGGEESLDPKTGPDDPAHGLLSPEQPAHMQVNAAIYLP